MILLEMKEEIKKETEEINPWGILGAHWSPIQVKRRRKQGRWRPGTKQTLS